MNKIQKDRQGMIMRRNFKHLCLFIFTIFIGATVINAKDKLKTVTLQKTPAGTVTFSYHHKLTQLIMEDVTDSNSGFFTLNVAQLILSPESTDTIIIQYTEGASVDPGFQVYQERNRELVRLCYLIDGLNCTVPGDGYLYISGNTNSQFNVKKKYQLTNGIIIEVKQPFYYLGLESKALADIRIYCTKALKEEIGNVKNGDSVSVILNDGKYYLLKTDRDILGWWLPLKNSHWQAEEIEGLYHLGD